MTNICTSCGKGTLSPIIKSQPFMIVKEQVTGNEIMADKVFVQEGKNKYQHVENTTSFYLSKEFGMVGLQFTTFSLSNLYMHLPPKGGRTKEGKETALGCEQFSIDELVKAAGNMKIIFLMGASTIKTFTGYNASEVYGLVCKSDLLPNVPVIIPAPNIDKLMAQPIGEMRNSLRVLAEQVEIYKDYMK